MFDKKSYHCYNLLGGDLCGWYFFAIEIIAFRKRFVKYKIISAKSKRPRTLEALFLFGGIIDR